MTPSTPLWPVLARDIRGIGFRTADQIAAKLGIEKTAMVRVRAGIATEAQLYAAFRRNVSCLQIWKALARARR